MAVVKANGYGHGALETARVALANGADRLGVAIFEEGIQLRQAGFTVPIIILGSGFPEQAEAIVEYDLTPNICSWDLALAVAEESRLQGKKIKVYVKLETGMNRIGIFPEDAVPFIKRLSSLDRLEFEGMFTHFSVADQYDKSYTATQQEKFHQVVKELEQAGIYVPNRSMANSAGIIDLPETHLEFVRPGIILYGVYPSLEVQHHLEVRQALTFKTRVIHLKFVPKGSPVSYGNTYIAPVDTWIATLPVGYADGYKRSLSNRGQVLIRGKRYPIAGRICMDQCMVEVGLNSNVVVGDEVVLTGSQGEETISVDELAELVGTIPHEIFCNISARVPRIYVGGGR